MNEGVNILAGDNEARKSLTYPQSANWPVSFMSQSGGQEVVSVSL
ncbi:MAG: hypothetical protein JWP94_1156 [Mucilaginibacter sp.]|nr:hypothetical protein [Mucilaginibacter sp.]